MTEKAYIMECNDKSEAILVAQSAKIAAKRYVESTGIPYNKLIRIENKDVYVKENCVQKRHLEVTIFRLQKTSRSIKMTIGEYVSN